MQRPEAILYSICESLAEEIEFHSRFFTCGVTLMLKTLGALNFQIRVLYLKL